MGQIFLLSQKLFELDPNIVCQSEALALKRTLNMFLRRVEGNKVVKNPSKVNNGQAEIQVCVSYKKACIHYEDK